MTYIHKHIIFTSCEIPEISEMSHALVVLEGPLEPQIFLNESSVDALEILSAALGCINYATKFGYELIHPKSGYEALLACNGNVDYIFTVSDSFFDSSLTELMYWLSSYESVENAVSMLENSAVNVVDSFLATKKTGNFPKNVELSMLIKQLVQLQKDSLAEVVHDALRKYQLYPLC